MSKPSPRKQKKQKARQRLVAKQKVIAVERRRYARNFPLFVLINPEDADPHFVELIHKAARSIDLRDRTLFHPAETEIYRMIKRHGHAFTADLLEELDGNLVAQTAFVLKLGTVIFSRIPPDKLCRYIPYNDVQALVGGRKVCLKFRSLRRQPSSGGTIYFSRRRPTIDIDGESKIVGFSRHAIERICQRIVPRWQTYAGLGEAFAFFDQCIQFDRCDLHGGRLAFTFYAQCAKGFASEFYVDEVLGCSIDDARFFYHRVGYCPAVIEGDFIKAITLFPPGYRGTPEYGSILQAEINRAEKDSLIQEAAFINTDRIKLTGDFHLIKWFHDHGVPQVIESDTPFYTSAAC